MPRNCTVRLEHVIDVFFGAYKPSGSNDNKMENPKVIRCWSVAQHSLIYSLDSIVYSVTWIFCVHHNSVARCQLRPSTDLAAEALQSRYSVTAISVYKLYELFTNFTAKAVKKCNFGLDQSQGV